jgi:hypothetical protein
MILLAVMLGGGGVAFLYRVNKWDSSTGDNTSRASPSSLKSPPKPESDVSAPAKVEPAPAKAVGLSGEWSIVNTVEKTSYPQYANLRLGYRIVIIQTGTEFTAEGEKVSEDERYMDPAEQTPIHLTGSVGGNEVRATFVEEGLRRKTSGRFIWTLATDNNQLRGGFVSTAAKSSGSSLATRVR